ncbi:MAG TPA: hypothetical protein VNS32_00850 [Flavisolibacter sp.]|nr:hypothetical protein [Flavisolibacter sp.]
MPNSELSIKRERFKKVASRRIQGILDGMDNLSKCANRSNYDYTNEDVNKMMKAIREKVRLLEISYTTNTKTAKNTFEF